MPDQDHKTAPLTENALLYSWGQLLERAGVGLVRNGRKCSIEGLDLLYEDPADVKDRDRCVVVAPCRNEAWHELLNRQERSLRRIPINQVVPQGARLQFHDSIPVMFWGGNARGRVDAVC